MTTTTEHDSPPRYRAFLSYSSADADRAQALHRRLEGYRLPRHAVAGGNEVDRQLRPIFRDDDELAGSGVLDDRLRAAIDRSGAMIVLASPAAAASRWVNEEVDHYLRTRGTQRLVIVLVDGAAAQPPALPPALRHLGRELIWLDGRRGLSRRSFLRLVAVLLDVDVDVLFRRDTRRRQQRRAVWSVVAGVLTVLVGGALWQAQAAADRDPARQEAAFRSFLEAKLRSESPKTADDMQYRILAGEDVDGNGLLDYFVIVTTPMYCGSGGCAVDFYLADRSAGYRQALSALGSSTPRTRPGSGAAREVIITEYSVSGEPIYSVYVSSGDTYALAHYEYCDGLIFEACSSAEVIPPVGRELARQVRPGAVVRERPDELSRPTTIGAGGNDTDYSLDLSRELGPLPGGEWSLVEVWKGSAGFVRTTELQSRAW